MKPNKQQKRRLDRTIIDYAVVGMLLLTLASVGIIGAACAVDSSDVRSPDAQIAVYLNSTVWGDPFALNISDRLHEEYEHEKSLTGIHDGTDPTRDFNFMRERGDMPPGEYQWMYDIAESGGADHIFSMPPDECRRMHEDNGDYGEIEHDKNMDGCTEGSSVISAGDEPVGNALASTSAYTPTATEEFSGEVVQLTGAQTADIFWNKNNFGGFYYDMDGGVGTETLAIAAGTLTGPNVDRTIEVGALSYTTYPFWREYELHRNLGLTVEGSQYGGDSGYWIEFWMGEMYVAANGKPDKLAKPLVEFNSTDTKTLMTGEPWDLGGGFVLEAKQIDLEGNKVWMAIEKNGIELDNEVIGTGGSDLQDRVYTYAPDLAGENDAPIFSCYVSEIFRGTDSNIVRVKYVFLIDNDILQISAGEYYGNMQVTSATPTQVSLGNWKSLYLKQYASTCHIMGNLSFKTVRNASAIEFYPHLIRNELPVLSGGGGFASDHCGWYTWDLSENYTIGWNQVSLSGNKAWIVLCKDGVMIDERILTEEWSAPVDSDCRYSYVRDGTEIVTATLKAAFRGCSANTIELGEVYQRSEVDGSILINNESHLFLTATEPTGVSWNLSDDYVLTVHDVGLGGDEVWLQLSKNDVVVKEKILNEDCANTFAYTSGVGGVNCAVDRVFRGCKANAVKLVNVNQYSDVSGIALIVDGSHFYKSGDSEGMPWELMDGYVLTMKDIDLNGDKVWLELSKSGIVLEEDILESSDLFEYRNDLESFDCVVEAVFHGCLAGVVKLKNVNQYSSTGTQLMDNESKTYATADPIGEIWERWEGYSLTPKDIDLEGDKVWLSLLKNGVSVKDAIIDSSKYDVHDANSWFKYHNATGALVFSTYVDAVFRGTDTNIVQVRYTSQYSEVDGRLFIEPDAESWQLQEGYYLTAQETYNNNSVWLQLSKDTKLVDEGLFYNSFYLQNDTTGHTIISGTISGYNHRDDYVQLTSVTQYHEATGTVLATWSSRILNASWSFKYNKKTLSVGGSIPHVPKTLTVNNSGGADYTSIQAAIDASESGDTILVYNGTYRENVMVNKQLELIGIGMPVVDGERGDSTIKVTASYCIIDGFRIIHGSRYYGDDAGISVSSYGNDIRNNSIHDNSIGIYLSGGGSNTLTNNTVSDNSYGIRLYQSSDNRLRDNEMIDNTYNFDVSAWRLADYTHDIDTSNTVNGKPVYYLVGKSGMVIDSSTNTGYVGVVNSSNIVVRDLTLENNGQGVLFAHTSGSRIENVDASKNCYGIYLYQSSGNTLTNNRVIDNSYGSGMCLQRSSSNAISGNNASCNRGYGISIYYSSYNSLANNVAVDNSPYGLYVYGNEDEHYNNQIYTSNSVNGKPIYYYYGLDNQIIQNLETTHLTVAGSTDVVIRDNNISGGDGIHLARSGGSSIRDNNISDNYCGIQLHSSDDTITGNAIFNNRYGVLVSGYSSNQIQSNVLNSNRYYGIYLSQTSGNTVSGNTISNSGVSMWYSSNNTISGNTVSDNGIYVWYSPNNTLTGNTITTQNRGLWVDGYQDDHFNNAIDPSNTVNGKPVYYYYNIHSQTIRDLDASHLTVACSSDVTITENSISGGDGIRLTSTSDSTVSANTVNSNVWYGMYLDKAYRNEFTDNTISNNDAGVYVDQSSENEFTDNLVSSNRGDGVYLSYAERNELTCNTISNNDDSGVYLSYSESNVLSNNEFYSNRYGIRLYDSQSNTIRHNSILGGCYGIYLRELTSDNRLYHNNLLYNTYANAYDCGSNHWYNETSGNYWDDYTGVDDDDDGIGDVPYNISGGSNQDPYPLVEPYDWEMPDPKTIYVDDDFVDDPVNHKWDTIGEGLGDAFYNDTIIVYNGTYNEYVQISMPTRLIGIGMPVVNRSSIQISADGCTLDGFRVISGGIRVYSDGNVISNNTMSGDYCGISLSSSSNNTLRNNVMVNFEVDGGLLPDYIHDIDTSNTVNGKPIYYLVNAESQVIDSTSNAGYVAAINSSGITVRDLTLRNNSQGVLFYHTNDSRIENVDVYDSGYGIMLGDSHGNYVMDNTINSTYGFAIRLSSSSDNTLQSNTVNSICEVAIYLYSSSDNILMSNTVNQTGGVAVYLISSGGNTLENNIVNSDYLGILVIGYVREDYNNSIDTSNTLNGKPIHYYYNLHDATIQGLDTTHLTVACSDNVTIRNNTIRDGDIMFLPFLNDSAIMGNTVQDNYLGMYLYTRSSNNTIHHNNFINNTGGNAYDEGIHNQWDSGTEGNYWKDYAGNDTDRDGIGDEPYYIHGSARSVDRYPLMQPWGTSQKGDLNHDGNITPTDAAIALQIAASGGWNADADMSGDDRVTSLDALMILQAAAGDSDSASKKL